MTNGFRIRRGKATDAAALAELAARTFREAFGPDNRTGGWSRPTGEQATCSQPYWLTSEGIFSSIASRPGAAGLKQILMVLVGWLVTGFGAFAGSILGNAAGSTGLKVGAIVGGIVGVVISSRLAIRWSWILAERGFAAVLGGLAGFAVAVPLTLNNMESPVVPVLSCALAGVGMLIGTMIART